MCDLRYQIVLFMTIYKLNNLFDFLMPYYSTTCLNILAFSFTYYHSQMIYVQIIIVS
jgi:hypothetical protein